MDFLFFIIIVEIIFSIAIAALADSRGRSVWGWFFIAFFFSPLLAGILLLVLTDKVAEAKANRQRKEDREFQLQQLDALNKKTSLDELLKLSLLRDNGVITSEEFNIKKAALLWS